MTRTFSGGMKRRLEIARGLIHRPEILFLDEPTTGLDPQTRARTWEVLRALRRDFGTTLFLTTHYMDEAENCDRIAVIDHGKIVALDTPAALKQRRRQGSRSPRAATIRTSCRACCRKNTASPARPSTAACRFWSRKGTPSSSSC